MSGRAQAANLTGMLSQLASDVGEMGKAYDWTHNAIRTLSMPEVDENDPKSLEVFAEWARRNGKDDIAYAYSKRAADLAVEQQKRAYTKSVAQGKEAIRGLLSSKDALEAKPIGNNELYGEPGQLPIQAQINNVPGQIQTQVEKLNDLGDSSRYGTGVEGSTALREVNAERMQALKDAIALRKSGFELTEAERKALEPVERKIYNTEATELMGKIRTLARIPNRTDEQQSKLDGYVFQLNELSSDYAHLSGIEVGAGTTYLNKEVDQFSQERSEKLARENAALTLKGKQRTDAINAEIDSGKNLGATLFAAGIREIPPARRATMTPDAIRAAETEISSSAEAADKVNEARENRTISKEDLAYAEELARGNTAVKAQLDAYKKELKVENVFDRSDKVAGKLQETIEKARKESGDLTQDLYRDGSISAWVATTTEYGDLTNWNDDIADILQDSESLEAIQPEIKKIMKAQDITAFEDANQFISIATQAARNLGYAPVETEESRAAVTDTLDFAERVRALNTSLYDEVYDSLEGSGLSEEGRVAKAKREAKKVTGNVMPHIRQFLAWNDIGPQRMQILNPDSPMSKSFERISLGDGQTLRDVLYEAVISQDTPVTLGQLGISYE